ncbi:MAG: acyltransferase [Porcipelethomonas sp.]
MGTTKGSDRNYGIDLLRMFAMFLIAMLHVLGQGGVLSASADSGVKNEAAWFLEIGAYCAVNCYAIISGYVGLGSKFKYTNIIMLWLQVVFYTLSITAVFSILKPGTVGEEQWIAAALPVCEKQYWYFTAYFMTFLFSPVLNKAVECMGHRQMKVTLISLLAIVSLPVLYTETDVFGTASGYSTLWLMIMYLLGAYIKKYNSLSYLTPLKAFSGYIASVCVTWAVKFGLMTYMPDYTNNGLLVSYTSPTIIAAGIFLFMAFKGLRLNKISCKIISAVSPLSFSVYIIHVHPLIWGNYVKGMFAPIADLRTLAMVPAVVGAAMGLYAVCSAADTVRYLLFKILKLRKSIYSLEMKIREKIT